MVKTSFVFTICVVISSFIFLSGCTTGALRNSLAQKPAVPSRGVLTPNGKTLFFDWAVTGISQVWKMNAPLRFPEQVTTGPQETSAIVVTPDEKNLVLSRALPGDTGIGIYLMPVDGGKLVTVIQERGVAAHYVWITNGGEIIYYFANDIRPDSYAFYSFNVATGQRELLMSEFGQWTCADVWADSIFLFAREKGEGALEYFTWNATDRHLNPIIGQTDKEKYIVRFAGGPIEFFVLTSKFDHYNRVYQAKPGHFDPVTLFDKKDIERIEIDHSRMHLYLHWKEVDHTRLEILNARTFDAVAFPEIKNATSVSVSNLSRYGRYVSLNVEMANGERETEVYDWGKAQLTEWLGSSSSSLDKP